LQVGIITEISPEILNPFFIGSKIKTSILKMYFLSKLNQGKTKIKFILTLSVFVVSCRIVNQMCR